MVNFIYDSLTAAISPLMLAVRESIFTPWQPIVPDNIEGTPIELRG